MTLAAQIDKNGRLKPLWPRYPQDIINLGKRYVEYETSLPPAQQLNIPPLTLMQSTLSDACRAADSALTHENQRAISAADYDAGFDKIKLLLDDALMQLKGKHSKNLAELRNYGLETHIGKRGDVLVERPSSSEGWIRFATKYVEQETALPITQRIVDPPLDRMRELTTLITSSRETRDSGMRQRGIGVDDRSEAVSRLMDYLQLAAFALVALRYDRCVTKDLELWGFNIVEKSAMEESASDEETSAPAI